ncbi:MAG: hypothetical protein IT582_08450 [Opitutaceae bacterium]|nr:hypothetical protein [Opitutaceae bacterium]
MNRFTDAQLSAALAEASPRWKFNGAARYREMPQVFALHLLAVAARREPTRMIADVMLADALAQKLHPLLGDLPADADGNTREPEAQGGIGGWTHASAAWILLLAKRTPATWAQLDAAERHRADLIMRALAVAGNFTMGDGNDCHILLDGVSTHSKAWNINITEGYVDALLAAGEYFGVAALDAFFANFDFDAFIAELRAANLMNIVRCWTHRPEIRDLLMHGGRHEIPPPKDALGIGGFVGRALGVRRSFAFQGLTLADSWAIFLDPGFRLFVKAARTRIIAKEGEHTYLLQRETNAVVSPWESRIGMCAEFESTDWYGVRSCLSYAFEGVMINVATAASLRALGLWRDDAPARELEKRMAVGMADLLFKAREGYRGWAHGKEFIQGMDDLAKDGAPHIFAMWVGLFAEPEKW